MGNDTKQDALRLNESSGRPGPGTDAVASERKSLDTGTASANDRLHALGYELPGVGTDSKYVNHRTVGSSIYVSGQLPYKDGELLGQGILGRDVDGETAQGLARQAALNALAVATDAVGQLDRVQVVQMLVFVASTPEFGEQSRVAGAASELLVDVLGENGRHARTALGVAGLPRATASSRSRWCARRCRPDQANACADLVRFDGPGPSPSTTRHGT